MYTVYRVEHKDTLNEGNIHYGPYTGSTNNFCDNLNMEHSKGEHLSITEDFTFEDYYDYFCCFDNLESLYNWFDGFMEGLIAEGFVIREYRISEPSILGDSGKQSVFHKDCVLSKEIVLGDFISQK